MLNIRSFGTKNSISLRSTTTIATKLLVVSALAVIAFCLLSAPVQPVHASGGSLSIGQITDQAGLPSCPGGGWYQPPTGTMTCLTASVINCPNAQSLQFTYGYAYPTAPYKGTVVFLPGGDGTTPSLPEDQEQAFAGYYYTQGYEVVQLMWSAPWEQTDVPSQSNTPYLANIQYAACRPATFLNFIHATQYSNTTNSRAGMCVQGASAGSAATAYSLAYYGAGATLTLSSFFPAQC